MPQPYRGRPDSVSRFVLPDGRTAALVPRERKHFSKLQNGYPLAEGFLNHLAGDGVDAVAVDDGERIYAFDLRQYRTGNRVGHAPYPMKRVAPLDEATLTLAGERRESEVRAAEWEWVTDGDLEPARDRSGRPSASSSSRPDEGRDESITSD